MIQVADNFNYRGKKPNFDRDSFDTLQDMKNYKIIKIWHSMQLKMN